MKLETFNLAKDILDEIRKINDQLNRIENILIREKGSVIRVGITGELLEFPKAEIVSRLIAKKSELEREKGVKEKQFNNL